MSSVRKLAGASDRHWSREVRQTQIVPLTTLSTTTYWIDDPYNPLLTDQVEARRM